MTDVIREALRILLNEIDDLSVLGKIPSLRDAVDEARAALAAEPPAPALATDDEREELAQWLDLEAKRCAAQFHDRITRAAALLRQPAPAPALVWTENRPPCEDCRYDHCIAETPFGRFLITWKGWKEHDSPTVDETPWGDWYEVFDSVDEAKAACQLAMDVRLALCFSAHPITPQ